MSVGTKDLVFIDGLCFFFWPNGLMWKWVLDLVLWRLMGFFAYLDVSEV